MKDGPDPAYLRITQMRRHFKSVDDFLAAGNYYLDQIENAQVDPVSWPIEVLSRAVDILEVMTAIRPGGTLRPISIDKDDIIDPRDRVSVALYQARVILHQKSLR